MTFTQKYAQSNYSLLLIESKSWGVLAYNTEYPGHGWSSHRGFMAYSLTSIAIHIPARHLCFGGKISIFIGSRFNQGGEYRASCKSLIPLLRFIKRCKGESGLTYIIGQAKRYKLRVYGGEPCVPCTKSDYGCWCSSWL